MHSFERAACCGMLSVVFVIFIEASLRRQQVSGCCQTELQVVCQPPPNLTSRAPHMSHQVICWEPPFCVPSFPFFHPPHSRGAITGRLQLSLTMATRPTLSTNRPSFTASPPPMTPISPVDSRESDSASTLQSYSETLTHI